MVGLYYDKDGKVISVTEWARLMSNRAYKVIEQTHIGPKGKGLTVSTVWLGLNHSYLPDAPMKIFETMVFSDVGEDGECVRYATLEDAKRGHTEMVKRRTWGVKE